MTPKRRAAIDKLKAASWARFETRKELERLRHNQQNRYSYHRLKETPEEAQGGATPCAQEELTRLVSRRRVVPVPAR